MSRWRGGDAGSGIRRRNRCQNWRQTAWDRFASLTPNPEQQTSNSELRTLLEEAVETLPDAYRTIFVLRDARK
jgi:DNA-directed RNA polymerase specialized sigma24 family protein